MSDLIPAHLAHIEDGGQSPLTIRARRELLIRLHHDLPHGLAFASTQELEQWVRQGRWSRWTQCTYTTHIRSFYRWATEVGVLDGNPAARMRRPRTPRLVPNPVTDGELARALDSPEPWYTACLLAAYAGLRCCEIAQCRGEHITSTMLYVPNGKGGEPAAVPTHPVIWAALASRGPGLLVTNKGRPVTGLWISARAADFFDRTGQLGVRMHRLRHWYGTAQCEQGADLAVVQQNMRHASPTSTVGYVLIGNQRRRQAVAALPVPKMGPAPAAD